MGNTSIGVFIFLLLSLIFSGNENNTIIAEEHESKSTKLAQSPSSYTSKIDPLIMAWQVETNQEVFANNNNISYSNGKIGVYIYLDDQSSMSKIPSDVEITATDANIVVAMVTSSQIDQLAQINSIEKISLPKKVTNPIIPKDSSEEISFEENFTLIIPIVIGFVIVAGISFIVYKRKVKH